MRLLILGTGRMAERHAEGFGGIDGVTLAGCVDVQPGVAKAFATAHGIARWFDDLDDALAAGGFDAVANVTPDAMHHQTTMKAIAAGLHVFCEKPLATGHADAVEMAAAAASAGVVHGVNLTYRNVAALQAAREVVEAGRLGAIRHFEASYLQSWLTQPAWGDWRTDPAWLWRLSSAHGSLGVLGDIGIHIMDFATFLAGDHISDVAGQLRTFDKAPGGRIDEYSLDANDSFTMSAQLSGGALGVIHASRFASGHLNDLSLKIFGETGGIRITNTGPLGTLEVCEGPDLETGTWRSITLSPVETNYHRFASAVNGGAAMTPDFRVGARLQAVIEAVFQSSETGKTVRLD